MLKVKGVDNADLAEHQPTGATYDVEWVAIDEPVVRLRPPARTGRRALPTTRPSQFVGNQGLAQGAAGFSRLEGAVYDHGWVYFTSTQGGGRAMTTQSDHGRRLGQGPGADLGLDLRAQTLHMLYESPGPDVLDFPDNVTTSARGTLIVCEDGTDRQLPARPDPQGRAVRHRPEQASPAQPATTSSPASTFSPDGETLFVNIQASDRHVVRDLGTLGTHRRLTGQQHGDGRRAVLAGRRRACEGRRVIIGVGIDVVDVDALHRVRCTGAAAARRGCSPTTSSSCRRPRWRPGSPRRRRSPRRSARRSACAGATPRCIAAHDGARTCTMRGTVGGRATELGVRRTHLSLSHDAGIASAVVVVED